MKMFFRFASLAVVAAGLVGLSVAAEVTIPLLSGEKWWGGAGGSGERQPYCAGGDAKRYDLTVAGHTSSPLLVSTKGRYLWAEKPFAYQFKDGMLAMVVDNNIRTARIIRKHIPDAKIAMLSLGWANLPWTKEAFACFKAEKALDPFDAIIYHDYSSNPDACYGACVDAWAAFVRAEARNEGARGCQCVRAASEAVYPLQG